MSAQWGRAAWEAGPRLPRTGPTGQANLAGPDPKSSRVQIHYVGTQNVKIKVEFSLFF